MLDSAGNKLTTLPESFGDLKSLRWLDVRDNPLSAAIKKEAGDCLDDKQCKTCALRVCEVVCALLVRAHFFNLTLFTYALCTVE